MLILQSTVVALILVLVAVVLVVLDSWFNR